MFRTVCKVLICGLHSFIAKSLDELASAALREGGIAETLSVLRAAADYDATPPSAARERDVLRQIVRDEARHAALAWRTVAWACATRGRELVAALRRVVDDEATSTTGDDERDAFDQLVRPLAAQLIAVDAWARVSVAAEARDAAAASLFDAATSSASASLRRIAIKAVLTSLTD